MDPTDGPGGLDQTYRLLALCARAQGHPAFYRQLAGQIERFGAWKGLPALAEAQGMAPLLWHHLNTAGLTIDPETGQILKGLYLRHRALNRAHALALREITGIFEQHGIRALVLKGLALAYQYYPDPALRPVSDIDLLLGQADVLHARQILIEAGFSGPELKPGRIPKELTVDSPAVNGIRAHVELHHYDPQGRSNIDNGPDDEFAGFAGPPQSFNIEACTVYAPATLDTLRYLSRHLVRHLFSAKANRPLQLKWIADIVSIVEQQAETLDFDKLRQDEPAFLNRLEVFYSLTPRPENAKDIPIRAMAPPRGVNEYPRGWPQQVFGSWRQVGLPRFVWRSFRPPSPWWLRLYYGCDERAVFWRGQISYPLHIMRLALWAMVR